MTHLTPERLAAIRGRCPDIPVIPPEQDRAALLAEVDRLRAGIADAEHAIWEAWVEGGDMELIDRARRDLLALIDPEDAP